jgi:hypothetical protein
MGTGSEPRRRLCGAEASVPAPLQVAHFASEIGVVTRVVRDGNAPDPSDNFLLHDSSGIGISDRPNPGTDCRRKSARQGGRFIAS